MTQVIYGLETDDAGRCVHYHQENDIAGLKCQQCQAYFACYQCMMRCVTTSLLRVIRMMIQ